MRPCFHHGRQNYNFHAEGGYRGGLGLIGGVDDKRAGEVGVEFGYAEGGGFVAELGEHFVGGAFQGFAADNGTDGENFFLVSAEMAADLGHGENWADANQRIAGADQDAVGMANGFDDAGSRKRGFDICKPNAFHDWFGAALYQIFLKMKRALVRIDNSGDRIV